MGYTKRIVCLANSRKHGGLCIAGRELTSTGFGRWIRPISARGGSELTYLEYRYGDHTSPQILDIVEVPMLGPARHGHQTENMLIDQNERWVKRGRAAFRRLKDLSEEPPTLWTNAGSTRNGAFDYLTPAEAALCDRSLYLIQTDEVEVEVINGMRADLTSRVSFAFAGVHYRMSVTDPLIREQYEPRGLGTYTIREIGDIFLCVSLSEVYKPDGRCHKLVAAVITDPPIARHS